MARAAKPMAPTLPNWDARKSLRALEAQLSELETLKGKSFWDAEQQEDGWTQVTTMIFSNAFASNSSNHRNFSFAENAGNHYVGMPPGQIQSNFTKRIEAFETCLKSAIRGLRLELPDDEIAGGYNSGDPFSFYKDLKGIVRTATQQFFLIDPYLDTQLFETYLGDIPNNVNVRVLTQNPNGTVESVSRLFAKSHGKFELRTASTLHDRIVFVDQRCWALGQSIKDAAVRKPTYIVEVNASTQAGIYEPMWNSATSIVKS